MKIFFKLGETILLNKNWINNVLVLLSIISLRDDSHITIALVYLCIFYQKQVVVDILNDGLLSIYYLHEN